ncbi:hypothetical protein MHYP_G00310250 [Metynnis hypsauchen]
MENHNGDSADFSKSSRPTRVEGLLHARPLLHRSVSASFNPHCKLVNPSSPTLHPVYREENLKRHALDWTSHSARIPWQPLGQQFQELLGLTGPGKGKEWRGGGAWESVWVCSHPMKCGPQPNLARHSRTGGHVTLARDR